MDINRFRANLKYGGARTSLFEVQITNPINGNADLVLPFMCRAASLPGMTLNQIEVFHGGRAIKVPGTKTYEDWNITVINDEDFKIRNALEEWSNAINSPEGNIRKAATSEQSLIKGDAVVYQKSQTGEVLRTYKFNGIFPVVISPIEMDWSNTAISESQVTFAVDYFTTLDGVTGNSGGA